MKLILASTSPRRIELLKQAGFDITVHPPGTEELEKRGEAPRVMVIRLAREKALAVAARLEGTSSLIIAADTTVVAPNGKTVFGKPRDPKDSARMLRALAGSTHTVLTGYCITEICGGKTRIHCRVVKTRVKMRSLSKAAIDAYIWTGEPKDKAGSYAAQGIGMSMIESISGSYTNVVGLPISQVIADLEKKFGTVPNWSKESR